MCFNFLLWLVVLIFGFDMVSYVLVGGYFVLVIVFFGGCGCLLFLVFVGVLGLGGWIVFYFGFYVLLFWLLLLFVLTFGISYWRFEIDCCVALACSLLVGGIVFVIVVFMGGALASGDHVYSWYVFVL